MYEFLCDHIFPGCTHKDQDEVKADVLERAAKHLREHHDLDSHDDRITTALEMTGVNFIRPV